MSRTHRNGVARKQRDKALLFAALGEGTRLALIGKLCDGQSYSISQLTEGRRLSRQAITKHLRVLEAAGIVHSLRKGRESLFQFDPQPIQEATGYLEHVSGQWDQALHRLKEFVERRSVSGQ